MRFLQSINSFRLVLDGLARCKANGSRDAGPDPALLGCQSAGHARVWRSRSGGGGHLVQQPVRIFRTQRALERPDFLGLTKVFTIGQVAFERHQHAAHMC